MLNVVQKGSATYAVYRVVDENAKVDHISQNMINNNQDEAIGLAPVQVEMFNGVIQNILFDITGKISLKDFINMRVSQSTFKTMLINIIETIKNLDEYMIDIHQVLLNIDTVYINQIDNTISLLCVVLANHNENIDLFTFFKTVVENSHVETVVNVNERDYFHVAWNITRNPNGFSMDNLKKVLLSGRVKPIYNTNNVNTEPTPQNGNSEQPPVKYNEPPVLTVKPVDIPKATPTITQQNQPQTPVPNAPQPFVLGNHEEKKKGGLLGRIFGSKGDNESSSSPKNNVKQGTLSGLKGMAAQNNNNSNSELRNTKAEDASVKSKAHSGGLARFKNGSVSESENNTGPSVMPNAVPQNAAQFAPQNIPQNMSQFTPQNIPQNTPQFAPQQSVVNSVMLGDTSSGTTVLSSMTFQGGVKLSDPGTSVLGNGGIAMTGNFPLNKQIDLSKPAQNTPIVDAVDQSRHYQPQPVVPISTNMNMAGVPNNSMNWNSGNEMTNTAVNYGETTVLDGGMSGETTVLNPSQLEQKPPAYLIRLKNNERIPITGNVFCIGKERSTVNYFISDNPAISRNHATIAFMINKYFIIDNNSTNHTFVDGKQIPTNFEVEIYNNMKIRLANEEFEFHS